MLKIYRQSNFEQPHEREKFRKICNLLSDHFKESSEEIFVFANIELPESTYTYRYDGDDSKKTVQANPDMFILKKNGAAVVELKNYPGSISWNDKDLREKNSWKSKMKGKPTQIINEGSPNPYAQTNYNRQALIGFLQTYENKFISKGHEKNQYYRARSILLFTHNNVRFEQNYKDFRENQEPSSKWSYTLHLSSLSKSIKNCDYFPNLVEDVIATPARKYLSKNDKKNLSKDEIDLSEITEISFDKESIEQIAKILKCKDVTKDYIGDFKDEETEDLTISTGLGYAHTLVHDRKDDIEILDKLPKPSKEILSLPIPLRTLLYYKQSILDESKNQNMDLYLNSRNAKENIFILKNMYDTIFSKNQPFRVADDIIQDIEINLKQDDPSLSYGLGLQIAVKKWMNKTFYTAEPLFSTSVSFENGSYKPSFDNDITINDTVLRGLPGFNNVTNDEYFDKKDNIMQKFSDSSENIIRAIYSETKIDQLNKNFDPFKIYQFNMSNIQAGFKPNTAAIFLSQSNFYKRLLSEIDFIFNSWKTKYQNDEDIDDLAYNFLNSFNDYKSIFNKNNEWNPPLFNILESNYEQSKSIGLATNMTIPISVVSGPPGTGKSQFSINTISEMNFKDKSVIFSSSNNKAVDVVSNKMNKVAPESITRLNKKDKNFEVEKFEHKPLNVNKRQELKSLINKNSIELNAIKKQIEEYEEAVADIDNIEDLITEMLNKNSELDLINWYSEDSSILNLKFWKSKLKLTDKVQERGFIGRAFDVFSSESELNFYDIINKESFINKNFSLIIAELKKNLPKQIIDKIGEENLITFSKDYLGLIEKLDRLSNKLRNYIKLIEINKNDKLYDNWGVISKKNIQNSLALYNDKIISKHNKFENKSITTLSIGKFIDNKAGLYDLAIFDEASQTDIVSAIPVLFRSKKVLVIGDEKQLNPIIGVNNEKDLKNWYAFNLPEDLFNNFSYTSNSLLSISDNILKQHNFSRTILKEHFRCHPNIIDFSNRFFYDNSLRIKTMNYKDGGIEFISHNGDCEKPSDNKSWINEKEISIVIEKILELKDIHDCSKIGVVTPFRAQASAIKNKISIMDSFSEKDLINLTIETAHQFQGDEKDIMIYSLTAGPSMPEKTYSWMSGSNLNNPYEKNLINVAVTRAKNKLYIIGNGDYVLGKSGLLTELINWTYFCNLGNEV